MIEDRYSSGVYPKRPIEIVRGRGCRVWDKNGNEYIDCVGGFGVVLVGHCNDFVIKSVSAQLKRLITCPEVFYNDVRAKLFKKIADITPKNLSRTFLSNSGTESVECALKIARKFTGKKEIIAMKKAFHGRTMGSLSATWKPKYRKSFEPLVPGFKHATFNDLESIEKLVTSDTAGIILEVVQGEGGVHIAEKNFIKGLRELCDNKDILLIIDEIQSGFGRTGKMFAVEHWGIKPDIMTMAKGITSAYLPFGAVAFSDEIWQTLKGTYFMSFTYTGHPACAAVAAKAIEIYKRDKVVENAARVGKYALEHLKRDLEPLPWVGEVSGLGLMLGIEIVADKAAKRPFDPKLNIMQQIWNKALEKGLYTLMSKISAGPSDKVGFCPPLVITTEEVDKAIDILYSVVSDLCSQVK